MARYLGGLTLFLSASAATILPACHERYTADWYECAKGNYDRCTAESCPMILPRERPAVCDALMADAAVGAEVDALAEAAPEEAGPRLVDECAAGTHDCDAIAVCADTPDGFTCTCPAGYADELQDGRKCVPVLSALAPSVGTLEPPFAPETYEYALKLPLAVEAVAFTVASQAAGIEISVASLAVASGTTTPLLPVPVGESNIPITLESLRATQYQLKLRRGVALATLQASNAEGGDAFGRAMALDGNTLAIGADREASKATGVDGNQTDNLAGNSGAVYVFTRDAAGLWTQESYLKASNTDAGDYFGASVALDGDSLVVGAPRESSGAKGVVGDQADDSAPLSGAAYVFARKDGAWSQVAYLKASNTGAGDQFGASVAIAGDLIVVGAPGEDSASSGVDGDAADDSAESSGAAYVFRDAGLAWSQEAYLKASNAGTFDWFGWAVSASGDTVVVGAPREGIELDESGEVQGYHVGAVYVFAGGPVPWKEQQVLHASNATPADNDEAGALFGRSLSLSADRLAVGASGESNDTTGVDGDQYNGHAEGAGAVYVWARSGGFWTQEAYLKASNTMARASFGWSVCLSGSLLAVGAPGQEGEGATYAFTRNAGVWSQLAYLQPPDRGFGVSFGTSVAVGNDAGEQVSWIASAPQATAASDRETDGHQGAAYCY